MLFWGVSLLEHCCIHGNGILHFSPFLRRYSDVINCFNHWNWKWRFSRLLLIPPSPPPTSLLLLRALRKRSGWRDGFKACDYSRESCVLFRDEIEGLYISFCHQWECWHPLPLPLQAVLRTTFRSCRREHENNEFVRMKSIQSVASHEMKRTRAVPVFTNIT